MGFSGRFRQVIPTEVALAARDASIAQTGLCLEATSAAEDEIEKILTLRKTTFNPTAWVPKVFENSESPAFSIPSGAGDIGMISVMQVDSLPIDAIDKFYAWCAPHDNPGGIYLYTAPNPLGPWTNNGIVFSTDDFNAAEQSVYKHVSSPDVHWDCDLQLSGETKGGFRIYFHYAPVQVGVGGQRTYLGFSKNGKDFHSFYAHNDYASAIIPIPVDVYGIDGGYSTYARFLNKGNLWLAFYSASTEAGMVGIGCAVSTDGGYTFKPQRQYLLPPLREEGNYAGVPGVLELSDVIYITYFCYSTTEGSIRLASINGGGEIVRHGEILIPSESGWDNFRVCESYPLIYDGKLYLFYSGRDDRDGHIQGAWPDSQIGVTVSDEVFA